LGYRAIADRAIGLLLIGLSGYLLIGLSGYLLIGLSSYLLIGLSSYLLIGYRVLAASHRAWRSEAVEPVARNQAENQRNREDDQDGWHE
jgi:hypothetical protein